jgi:acetamidase/formamidase/AraC-like DNA-binding protein
MDVERFSTDPFPLDRRFSAWDEALRAAGLGGEPEAEPPSGKLVRRTTPQGTDIVLIAGAPQRLARTLTPGADRVWLGTFLEGTGWLPGGEAARERELLYWPAASGPLCAPVGRFRLVLLGLSRLDPRWVGLPEVEDDARSVVVRPGPQPVLSGLLATIADAAEEGAEGVLNALENALAEIMSPMLGSGLAARAALRRRILRAIERRLDNPHLNLARFAEAEGVSARAVQKLLEDDGRTFSQHLRNRRLERAAEALVDPAQAALAVGEIGFRWGFPDPAHFSRAFRQHYGTTPSTYRAEAQGPAQGLLQDARSRSYSLPMHTRENLPTMKAPLLAALRSTEPAHHRLRATPETVHWGYFSRALPPVLTVRSGDTVTVDTLTQHASDDPARMIAGDPDAEAVFRWTAEGKAIDRRGAGPLDATIHGRGAGEGLGVHILTGPIAIEEAEPGDVLEIEILDVAPRPSQAPGFVGRSFGSNAATWWGRHYDDLLTGPKPREVVTIYEICTCGNALCAHAAYSFRWTPQRDPFGVLHPTMDYPGVPVDHGTIEKHEGVLHDLHVPVRPHFGTIGLASDHPGLLDSVPPSAFGGNIDNWRLSAGTKLFLPISVAGAMLSIGDPHAAQGDGEVSGTAIECSLTGTLRLRVHARESADAMLRDLTYPLIETAESWIVQGFSHPDYFADLGGSAQSEVYKRSSLDSAMRDAFRKARRFLMTAHGLSEDEAISLLSVAVDFGITQVVDGNWGVHATIPKSVFSR